MSVQDDAQKLISLANAYVEKAINANTRSSNAVGSSIGSLEVVRLETTGSLAQAIFLMGEGHPALNAIVSSSLAVNRKSDEIAGLMEESRSRLVGLDQLINVHSETIALIGRQLMQGR